MRNDVDLLAELTAATEGLLFPSETDAPVTPFEWAGPGEPTPQAVCAANGIARGAPVEASSLEAELGPLSGDDGGDDAPRWRALSSLLGSKLEDVRVLRVGGPDVLIVIVGRAASGAWLGVTTRAVET
jgi:hypothetical protein